MLSANLEPSKGQVQKSMCSKAMAIMGTIPLTNHKEAAKQKVAFRNFEYITATALISIPSTSLFPCLSSSSPAHTFLFLISLSSLLYDAMLSWCNGLIRRFVHVFLQEAFTSIGHLPSIKQPIMALQFAVFLYKFNNIM